MFDVALSKAGGQVVLATSSDPEFPPENMIDGNNDTFWTTTGRFPQEFIISFQAMMKIKSANLRCCNVRGLMVEVSPHNEPVDFELLWVSKGDMDQNEGQLQNLEIDGNDGSAQHMRFTILSGHDHFCSVHRLHIDGTAAHS